MLGFVKSSENKYRPLGGDVIRQKKRRIKIIFIVLGFVAFGIVNLILYTLTKI